ncbi:hypothetical protein SEA_GIRLPOWER_50 [Streptomyces phage GirlPower]|nr:hypothetical protein SEA_GIRLPOWER_50 [Streptomyces phage GirlPower]
MTAPPARAYNELLNRLLTPEDKVKFESVVGAMLVGDPPQTLVISGPVRSGKTTLMRLVHKLALFNMVEMGLPTPQIVFQHTGYSPVTSEAFVFVETNEMVAPKGSTFIVTTGDRLPVNKYYVLMEHIESEMESIAEHCIRTYENTTENNR